MSFNSDSVVEECIGANDSVPNVTYNLVPLSQIAQMEPNAIVGESIFNLIFKLLPRQIMSMSMTPCIKSPY